MGKEEKKELYKKILTNFAVYLIAIALLVFLGPRLLRFFMPMIVAWLIAAIANPIVVFLENKIKIMRKHGSAIVIVSVLILVGALLYFVIYATAVEVASVISNLPQTYKEISGNLQNALQSLHERFSIIPDNWQEIIGKKDEKLNEIITSTLSAWQTFSISAKVGKIASSFVNMFILTILTLMMSYFFVAERDRVRELFKKALPKEVKDFWNTAVDTCLRALVGYLTACLKIMVVVFVVLLIIFAVFMQSEYALLLALLTAFLDFFPFLGTGIIIAPWAIYCIITGEYVKTIILILAYVVCLLAHRLLEPKLVGDSIGMSPFATLISMVIGYRLCGMLGLILGIPVGMIVIAFYEQGVFEPLIRGIKILAHDVNEYRKY